MIIPKWKKESFCFYFFKEISLNLTFKIHVYVSTVYSQVELYGWTATCFPRYPRPLYHCVMLPAANWTSGQCQQTEGSGKRLGHEVGAQGIVPL